MESIFSRLPQAFFIPLASPNRRHYATLLLLYYRLFMDYRSGVERELVVARFAEYFAGLDAADAVEREEDPKRRPVIPNHEPWRPCSSASSSPTDGFRRRSSSTSPGW